MTDAPINALRKGDYALVHTVHSAYHLHTGRYHWSRFHVVEVLSSDKTGRVKTYRDNKFTSAPTRVSSKVLIYALPEAYADKGAALFNAQALDFLGYESKADLKTAFENAL